MARFPFRYYMALRIEMLLDLHREATAIREAQEENSGMLNVDRRLGISG